MWLVTVWPRAEPPRVGWAEPKGLTVSEWPPPRGSGLLAQLPPAAPPGRPAPWPAPPSPGLPARAPPPAAASPSVPVPAPVPARSAAGRAGPRPGPVSSTPRISQLLTKQHPNPEPNPALAGLVGDLGSSLGSALMCSVCLGQITAFSGPATYTHTKIYKRPHAVWGVTFWRS